MTRLKKNKLQRIRHIIKPVVNHSYSNKRGDCDIAKRKTNKDHFDLTE